MRGALFENQIEEYEVVFKSNHEYEIANAPLKAVLGRYATREDDCQMSFGGQAMIQDLDPEAKAVEPEYQPIATIPRTTDADVLGIFLFVEDTRSITTSAGVAHEVREIVITNQSTEEPLTISVWDDLTGTEASFLKSWVGPDLVIGFTALKPSSHKGFSLSTTMTTVFDRSPVGDRVNALRKWSVENRALVLARLAHIREVRDPTDRNEILSIEAIKLKEVGNTLQEEKHWIKVTIPDPERSKIVPYIGCNNCGKRTEVDCDASFTCKFCNKEGCIAAPRITFKFDATDATGTLTFTAFTQECEAFFKMTASQIYAEITAGIFNFEPIAHRLSLQPFLLQIGPATALARNKILTWVPKNVRWN